MSMVSRLRNSVLKKKRKENEMSVGEDKVYVYFLFLSIDGDMLTLGVSTMLFPICFSIFNIYIFKILKHSTRKQLISNIILLFAVFLGMCF
jgi:hypothetical protein